MSESARSVLGGPQRTPGMTPDSRIVPGYPVPGAAPTARRSTLRVDCGRLRLVSKVVFELQDGGCFALSDVCERVTWLGLRVDRM
eukprot:3833084-Rhodomonas_salina.6